MSMNLLLKASPIVLGMKNPMIEWSLRYSTYISCND